MDSEKIHANAIGIDLGGTRIKGVLLECRSGNLLHSEIMQTDESQPESWQNAVMEIEKRLYACSEGPVAGVGIAAPGLAGADGRSIANMPGRMSGLENFDWAGFLQKPVSILNDAHAALFAEAHYGCGKGLDNIVMLTLGTGVGGGLWLNGKLYEGFLKRAGHLGHISLDSRGIDPDITQIPGSLENAIGNATVPARSFNRYRDTEMLVKAYELGEPLASLVWLNSVRDLAVAIASLINTFAPDLVIIGGGITLAGESLFGPLQQFLDVFEWRPSGNATPVKRAFFDEWSGAVGAAAGVVYPIRQKYI